MNARRAAPVLLVALVVAALAAAWWARPASGHPELVHVETVAGSGGYVFVELTFSEDVHPLHAGAPLTSMPLSPDNFTLIDAPAGVSIEGVTQTSAPHTWQLALSGPVVPHETRIAVASEIGDADGVVAFDEEVPLTDAHRAALEAALGGYEWTRANATSMPLVQAWVQENHTLAQLAPGLVSWAPGLATGSSASTDEDFLQRIADHDAVTEAWFEGATLHVVFDDALVASEHVVPASFALSDHAGKPYELYLDGDLAVNASLNGTLTFDIDTTTGSVSNASGAGDAAPRLRVATDAGGAPLVATGALGLVDVAANGTILLDATVSVASAPHDVSGTANFTLRNLTIDLANFTVNGASGAPLLAVEWSDLSQPLRCDSGSFNATGICWDGTNETNPVDNVAVTVDAFDAKGLRVLSRFTMADVLRGLAWLPSWLDENERNGVLRERVPIVGETLGDLVAVSRQVANTATALQEVAGAVAGTEGSVSAQDLVELCSRDVSEIDVDSIVRATLALPEGALSGTNLTNFTQNFTRIQTRLQEALALCDGVLSKLNITEDAIEYTFQIDRTYPVFDTPPTVDLGLGADLEGFSVGAGSATWVANARLVLNLTLGFKTASDAELGLDATSPQVASRFYVKPTEEAASVALDVSGDLADVTASLGFLDFTLAGDASLQPVVTLALTDVDDNITLVDMASAADNRTLGDLVSIGLTGNVSANFTLANDVVLPTPARLQILGPLAALGNPGNNSTFQVHRGISPAWDAAFNASRINVGHNLGVVLDVKNVTASQVIAMIAKLAREMAAMTDSDAMSTRVPFVDVTFAEAVGFAEGFARVAEGVAAREPEDLSSFESALQSALGSAGFPDQVRVTVTPEAILLRFDASKEVARSYPFSFAMDDLEFAPTDGGATLEATARARFEPTLGFTLENATNANDSLDTRVFLQGAGPVFELVVDANVFGSVYLGPAEAGLVGNVDVGTPSTPARLAVGLGDPDHDGRTTLAELHDILNTTNSSLFAVTYGGPVSASLNVSLAGLPGTAGISLTGDLSDPRNMTLRKSGATLPRLTLDLRTLIGGSIEAAHFVGRTLEKSDVVGEDVPLVGDSLTSLTAAGADVRRAAETMRALWTSKDGDQGSFYDDLEETLRDELCPGSDCVNVTLLPLGATLGAAEAIEVELSLADEIVRTTRLAIDEGVFDLDLNLAPTLTVGYRTDLVLGLNVTHGFYVKAGSDPGNDALQLYGRFSLDDIDVTGASIAGITANITDGRAWLNGTLGPARNAGGFAISINDSIPLRNLSNRQRGVDSIVAARFEASIHAELPVTLAAQGLLSLDVPVILDVRSPGGRVNTTLTLGNASHPILLDVGSIVDGVIGPALDSLSGFDPANHKYNPLAQQEIVDALDTKIPVIEATPRQKLSEGAATFGYQNEWALVEFLIDVGKTRRALDNLTESGKLELGFVQVLPTYNYTAPTLAPWQQPSYRAVSNVTSVARPTSWPAIPTFPGLPPGCPSCGPPANLTILRFPILQDPSSAVKLVLGKDLAKTVTFVEIAPPRLELGPKVSFTATLISLDAGFIEGELKVMIDGFIGIALNTGVGYDSTGLRTGDLSAGFYIIDRPGNEIALVARISASVDGHFSVFGDFASIRFRGAGGASAEVGLDLMDESPALPLPGRGDGKLHVHEIGMIADAYLPPAEGLPSELCMFQLRATILAHLAFSGTLKLLGITVFSESWSDSWTLLDETLSCQLRPMAAHVDARRLVLNGGAFADRRFDGIGDVHERFTVTPNGGNVDVRVDLTPGGAITTSFPASEFDVIYADLGAGDDSVTIHTGIAKPAVLLGGVGDDALTGGDGDDEIDGGPGNDTLDGAGGADLVRGGADDDVLWAGAGLDLLEGGGGANAYVVPDGWGVAEIVDEGRSATLDVRTSAGFVGTASYDEGELRLGESLVEYSIGEVARILGSHGADYLSVNNQAQNGLLVDLRGGNDTIWAPFSGVERAIRVSDESGEATLVANGTAASDTLLFRARCEATPDACGASGGAAQIGFVALVTPGGDVERLHYDDGLSLLVVNGEGGDNEFVIDDVAAPLLVQDGDGEGTFQVGQVFGNPSAAPFLRGAPYVDAGDEVRARGVAGRGALSLGVSHPTVLEGGGGNDTLTVFSNVARLHLGGGDGDDLFILRAFILEGSVLAAGGDGQDRFEYVPNEHVTIDGGAGFNTLMIIGTELSDGFVVDAAGVRVCPQLNATDIPASFPVRRLPNATHERCGIDATFTNIQSMIVHGLAGNDAFWVRSTNATIALRLFGGIDGATFLVGDHGDLSGIRGPVLVDGEADPEFDASVPAPIVLPGEDATPGGDGLNATYDDQTDALFVDGSADALGLVGGMTAQRVLGLGMGDDVVLPVAGGGTRLFPGGVSIVRIHEATVLLGEGSDAFTIESTPAPELATAATGPAIVRVLSGEGDDDVAVRAIAGETTIETGAGDDVVRAGSRVLTGAVGPDRASTLTGIAARLHVAGTPGAENRSRIVLDASGSTEPERVDVEQALVTQLSMPGNVTHEDVDLLEAYLSDGADVANVRGTSTQTVIHGLDGDDRAFVSDVSAFATDAATPPYLDGTLANVTAALHFEAGEGEHLLMVSDRASLAPATGALLDDGLMRGLAPGDITYDATGTFARGVTVWLGSGDDQLSIVGARLDGDATTLAWEGRAEGLARTITTLNARGGDDNVTIALQDGAGYLVVNAGEGDDDVDGAASAQGFVVFGGLGNDALATGSGDDIVFGDAGRVESCDATLATRAYHGGVASCGASVLTSLGDEDDATVNDGLARAPSRMYSLATAAPTTDGVPYALVADGAVWSAGFNNRIHTGGGDDVAWGGPGSDVVSSGGGRNALLGDHGEVWRFAATALGGPRTIRTSDGFIAHQVLDRGIAYVVDVTMPTTGGDDVVIGAGDSWIFAGRGNDIVNGAEGDDIVWGGDGHDLLWGGVGADRVYGGEGDDVVDLKRNTWLKGLTSSITNADWWNLAWHVAPAADVDADATSDNGDDFVYGGRGRDVMHADRGAGGPRPGDRLADWFGSYNLYLVCRGPYGAGSILREQSPGIVNALGQLASADGAYDVGHRDTSGWTQLALVVDEHSKANRGAPHPDSPGNGATC